MSTREETEKFNREMEASAVRAEPDLEVLLAKLSNMADARRPKKELEAAYEALRDQLRALLEKEGPRYFTDDWGNKRYAFSVMPEPLVVNLPLLKQMVAQGQLDESILDLVAPRQMNNVAFEQAIKNDKITDAQFILLARYKKGTGHVKFSKPLD